MMSNHPDVVDEQFLDTCDKLSTLSVSRSDSSEHSNRGLEDAVTDYEVWTKELESVDERRNRFLNWIGLSSDFQTNADEDEYLFHQESNSAGIDRLKDDGEAVLANLDYEEGFFSTRSLPCSWLDDTTDLVEDGDDEEEVNPTWKIKNLDNGAEFVIDELAEDGSPSKLRELGSNKMITLNELEKILGSSSLVREFLKKESKGFGMADVEKREKMSWIQRFGARTRLVGKAKGLLDRRYCEMDQNRSTSSRNVHVHIYKKHCKELTSLYAGQQIPAHEGSVLTMKFSPDGHYLASGGVDGVVRVWEILQVDITDKFSSQDIDPSSLYFTVNQFSKVAPLSVANKRNILLKNTRTSESSCAVLPPKVFQLSEEPLHEFRGHKGEVLAITWSRNGNLLSSSVDKTVRLWKVGHDGCFGVFMHNNYVTCVEFNPVNDNHFISGSIDGKLRIWEVESGRVIDWIDIREIVTAICYSPNGQGGVVGSMDGNCRYYNVVDNLLQLGAQVSLSGKKKLSGKRITGLQYCPNDATKLMVSCADSQVQILCGTDVICKFKGNKSSGSQVPASFTSDGEHIVSIGDDSNVRVWNYSSQDQKSSPRPQALWSHESFPSRSASSIAIPWMAGSKNRRIPECLGYLVDALYRGSGTWPEDRLKSNPIASVCRSELRMLKNAWMNALNSPHLWGLVIVTGGLDGCIRTFLNYGLPIRI